LVIAKYINSGSRQLYRKWNKPKLGSVPN
jgi:hypothetical protein